MLTSGRPQGLSGRTPSGGHSPPSAWNFASGRPTPTRTLSLRPASARGYWALSSSLSWALPLPAMPTNRKPACRLNCNWPAACGRSSASTFCPAARGRINVSWPWRSSLITTPSPRGFAPTSCCRSTTTFFPVATRGW